MHSNSCPNHLPEIRDYGPNPLVVHIDCLTKCNNNFRTALWTGNHFQMTLMSIPPHGEIGLEMHEHVDQFIRIEAGCGLTLMGNEPTSLSLKKRVCSHHAIIIPAGTWHNLINTGTTALKLYSIYAPAQHPFGTQHKTREEAQFYEAKE